MQQACPITNGMLRTASPTEDIPKPDELAHNIYNRIVDSTEKALAFSKCQALAYRR